MTVFRNSSHSVALQDDRICVSMEAVPLKNVINFAVVFVEFGCHLFLYIYRDISETLKIGF